MYGLHLGEVIQGRQLKSKAQAYRDFDKPNVIEVENAKK